MTSMIWRDRIAVDLHGRRMDPFILNRVRSLKEEISQAARFEGLDEDKALAFGLLCEVERQFQALRDQHIRDLDRQADYLRGNPL